MQKAMYESMKDYRDDDISIAIEKSLQPNNYQDFEPTNPHDRQREKEMPVGLKNIGNTCYFNSLLQSYFFNTMFRRLILGFRSEEIPLNQIGQVQTTQSEQAHRVINFLLLIYYVFSLFHERLFVRKAYFGITKAFCVSSRFNGKA